MNRVRLSVGTLVLAFTWLFNVEASAATITFNNRALFNVAAPGLPVEDFQEANVAAGGIVSFADPLDSSSNNAVFATGEILLGLTVNATGADTNTDLVALGAGFPGPGHTSIVVGPNGFVNDTDLQFAAANAVGFDIWINASSQVTVSYFGAADALLGSTVVAVAPGAPTFFGVINDSGPITRILVATSSGELVDDIAFGSTAVPEPTTMLLFAVGVAAGASRRRRRRS